MFENAFGLLGCAIAASASCNQIGAVFFGQRQISSRQEDESLEVDPLVWVSAAVELGAILDFHSQFVDNQSGRNLGVVHESGGYTTGEED
jgi:hypothetical protein